MLSIAAFHEGRFAQAFPSFGSERAGAPVSAFCRIDDREIRLREPVIEPDGLIVLDATLLPEVDVFEGLRASGCAVVNSPQALAEPGLADRTHELRGRRVFTLSADEIATKYVGRPLPNTAMLGAFAALSECVRLDSLIAAIRSRFAAKLAEANSAAAAEAYAAAAAAREVAHA